jgi:hypothetical protein
MAVCVPNRSRTIGGGDRRRRNRAHARLDQGVTALIPPPDRYRGIYAMLLLLLSRGTRGLLARYTVGLGDECGRRGWTREDARCSGEREVKRDGEREIETNVRSDKPALPVPRPTPQQFIRAFYTTTTTPITALRSHSFAISRSLSLSLSFHICMCVCMCMYVYIYIRVYIITAPPPLCNIAEGQQDRYPSGPPRPSGPSAKA